MHKLISLLSAVAAFLVPCPIANCATTNAQLAFYFVSEQKVEGGRFFDAFPFSNLGYIASKPDLMVTNLKAVTVEAKPEYNSTIEDKSSGKTRAVRVHPRPRLFATLTADDSNRLMELTERAVGQRVLVMLGDKPLSLRRVVDFNKSPSFPIAINSASETRFQQTEEELKKLIRQEPH